MGKVEKPLNPWIQVPCIAEEHLKKLFWGGMGCDHDDIHRLVTVGVCVSEEDKFKKYPNLLFDYYVNIVAEALEISYEEAKGRIYVISSGERYGFCVELDGFNMTQKLKPGDVLVVSNDCGWKKRGKGSHPNMENEKSGFVGRVPVVTQADELEENFQRAII